MAMQNVLYSFGPNGAYFYNAPSASNLPDEVHDFFAQVRVADVQCAAFGTNRDCYFFLFTRKDGDELLQWVICGEGLPSALKAWLLDDDGKYVRDGMDTKVILGPDDSFFAWDPSSIRWSNIPEGLEKAVQSWLSPTGWVSGPPRIVALGCYGSFFALSQLGAYAYSVPASLQKTCSHFNACGKDTTFSWSGLELVSFDASTPDQFVMVHGNTLVQGEVSLESQDDYRRVSESFATEAVRRLYTNERLAAEKANDEAKKAEQARTEREEALLEELQLQYVIWSTKCDAMFRSTKPIIDFPHLPVDVCACAQESCLRRKTEIGLLACRHDVEKLLRASGQYSVAWLRLERLAWHPDKFGRKCSHAHKLELQKLSTELYAIFEELIASESP
ncbi:MAG: hypothetical protein Q9217_001314 [Psora testacea]